MGGHRNEEGVETLGPCDFGQYLFSFNVVKHYIFIRHGEKPPKPQPLVRKLPKSSGFIRHGAKATKAQITHDTASSPSIRHAEEPDKAQIFIQHDEKPSKDRMTGDLEPQGQFRANNLYRVFGAGNNPAGYGTPNVIYAMKAKPDDKDASNRPFETVQPLAIRLGMKPQQGERTPDTGGEKVFDNQFTASEHERLKEDVEAHCLNGDFRDKTIMFCWEHKNIPYIVAKFGLTTDKLSWGLNPFAREDDDKNFTAIWIFTPSENTFKVYRQFDITGDSPDNFAMQVPPDGYGTEFYSGPIHKDNEDMTAQ